jgi:predicted O-methyltransferase YrrM
METITLREVLEQNWRPGSIPEDPDGTLILESIRKRENLLRRWLHPGLIRRLDRGFARSNTVHPDTGRALYAISRASSAKCVYETGTYWGYTTSYLAAGLVDGGKVYSFDIYRYAGKHIPKSLRKRVELHRGKPSIDSMPAVLQFAVPDIFFQDSRHDYAGVAAELRVVAPHLRPGAVVLFHDFVLPDVRRAALEILQGYRLYLLDTRDPQQLGIAIKH